MAADKPWAVQLEANVDYRFEQRGQRPSVGIAVALCFGMAALGLAYGAPWYFAAIPMLSAPMALAVFVQDSRSGLRLEGDTLTLFKDRWRHVIDVRAIRRVRVTTWSDGQPDIWLDFDHAPPYQLPGYCFGSAEPLKDALRQRGIAVAQEGMDIVNTVIMSLILVISVLLVLTPPVAVWRVLPRQASGRAAWLLPALALIGPFVAVFVFVVLMWLPAYSGQCGGWLGFDSAEPELFGTIFELIEDDLSVSEALLIDHLRGRHRRILSYFGPKEKAAIGLQYCQTGSI